MLCSELMKRNVELCLDTSLVPEAAIAMRDRNVGFLPVCDETRNVIGTITDRDIVVRLLAASLPPDRTRVADVKTHEVVSCRPDDELAVAEDMMMRFQKSRVVCTDAQRRVVGVISLSDIARVANQGHAGLVAASIASREAVVPALPRGAKLTCRHVMKTDVGCVLRTEQVPTIARTMRDRNIGFVPVCDDKGAVVGTLTDRDLVVRVVAERRAPEATRAGDVFTREVVSCSPDDPLSVAEDLMVRRRKSRIVCLGPGRRAAGIVSLADIARVERSAEVSRVLGGIASRPAAVAAAQMTRP